jgi:hypothetical protein
MAANDKKVEGAKDGVKNNGKGKNAGANGAGKSNVPQLPTTSTPSGGDAKRMSPAAVAGAVVKSLKDLGKRLPTIPGMPRQGGGGRGTGEKALLLALFFIKYAKWTGGKQMPDRFIPNGIVKNVFGEGLPATKENRMVYIFNAASECVAHLLFGEIPAWVKEHHEGAMPQGFFVIPEMVEDENADTGIAVFRKNADLAEHFTKLSQETADEALKAEYAGYAEYYGNANKYDGFVCSTVENREAVLKAVREFYALNPECKREFMELEDHNPVYGQETMKPVSNVEYWSTTAEGKAELAEREKQAAAEKEAAAANA